MKIYVANISYKAKDNDLKDLFERHGAVISAKIIVDKTTQRSRGFGFVEMEDDDQARQAMEAINGVDFLGRNLVVNEAKPRP